MMGVGSKIRVSRNGQKLFGGEKNSLLDSKGGYRHLPLTGKLISTSNLFYSQATSVGKILHTQSWKYLVGKYGKKVVLGQSANP